MHPFFIPYPMHVNDVTPAEYSPFYTPYVHSVSSEYNLIEELEISLHRFIKFVQNIPMDKFDYRYAEGKWTIKEIIQHLMDAERIFAYRALRFARMDATELPGFDEHAYASAVNAFANKRKLADLLTEYTLIRQSSIALFKNFTPVELTRGGQAAKAYISVRAIGFIIIGHQNHHQRLFQERYLDA